MYDSKQKVCQNYPKLFSNYLLQHWLELSNIVSLLPHKRLQSIAQLYCFHFQRWLPYNTWFLELIRNRNLNRKLIFCTQTYTTLQNKRYNTLLLFWKKNRIWMYFLNQMEETFNLIVLVEINILQGKINFLENRKMWFKLLGLLTYHHFKSAKFLYSSN